MTRIGTNLSMSSKSTNNLIGKLRYLGDGDRREGKVRFIFFGSLWLALST